MNAAIRVTVPIRVNSLKVATPYEHWRGDPPQKGRGCNARGKQTAAFPGRKKKWFTIIGFGRIRFMGKKGAKLTEKATNASERLERLLTDVGDISRRKMFGAYGIFERGDMFALVTSEGEVYFKVTDQNRHRFEAAGSQPYGRMPYFSVPDSVHRDKKSLCEWALTSINAAHEARLKHKKKASYDPKAT